MEDELLKHVYDIKEAALAILRFVRGKTFDDYEQDDLLWSGVERKFEIIGEALNRITLSYCCISFVSLPFCQWIVCAGEE